MKKKTVFALAMLLLASGTKSALAQPYAPSASKEIYDFSGFSDVKLLELFKTALEHGHNYPTLDEFRAAGIQESDIAFVRSHVKKRNILGRDDRIVPTTYEKREFFMNTPAGVGNNGAAGYPSSTFHNDVFSMWNYTNLYGAWNHSFFKVPGAWVDAAHKNGTDILSGVRFFDTTGDSSDGSQSAYGYLRNIVYATDSNGEFIYVKPMINCLMYFGSDGINYNWEDAGWSQEKVVKFHKALYAEAKRVHFDNFHIMMYNGQTMLPDGEGLDMAYGTKEKGKTCDFMLNYSGEDFSFGMAGSYDEAMKGYGSADGLYAGAWIVSMNKSWSKLDYDDSWHKCNLAFWGEHKMSRFYQYNYGSNAYELASNYQKLLERVFSGGNRNPLKRPDISNWTNEVRYYGSNVPLSTFCGMAQFIPERSAITGTLPFYTGFNIGNGDRYNYKGKRTASGWYNMGNQDIVPTYRWLVLKANTSQADNNVNVEFSPMDAYTGGTCLALNGKATAQGTDIVLYKTDLKVSTGNVYAKLAVKNGKEGKNASNLSIIVRKKNDNQWIEIPYGEIDGKEWQEKKLDISALSVNDVIDRVGLRVKGNDDNYNLYVGELEINDDVKQTPSDIKKLTVEVREETQKSMSFKLFWDVNATAVARNDWGLVYNDEANIDHFEILFKNGEDGRVSEIGRTTQWATYIGNKELEDGKTPYVGVRAVSTDLKTYSPVVWQAVTRSDMSQLPEEAGVDLYGNTELDELTEGADIARKRRYIEVLKTEGAVKNLDYKADAPQPDGTQYVHVADQVLEVKQGSVIKLFFKAAEKDDGLKYCLAKGYIDLNGDHMFNGESLQSNPTEGENLFNLGTVEAGTPEFYTGVTTEIKIPADAHRGLSRLRLVFSDAWFSHPGPTGKTNKGFSIDVDVKIVGDTEGRPVPADLHDQGVADIPEGLDVNTSITHQGAEVQDVKLSDGNLNFSNVDYAWVYTVDGQLVKYLVKPSQVSAQALPAGLYIIKMQKGNVIRSRKVVIR